MSNIQENILDSLENNRATVFLWKRTGKNFHTPFPVIYKIDKIYKDKIEISPRDILYQDKFPKEILSWDVLAQKIDEKNSSLWLLIDGLRYNSDGSLETQENKEESKLKL
jgi:hypothetical protein